MKLGTIIRKWRVTQELTQLEVAADIGIDARVLGRFEAGGAIDGPTLAAIFGWMTRPFPLSVGKVEANGDQAKTEAQK